MTNKYHVECLYCGKYWTQFPHRSGHLDIEPCTKCGEKEKFKATKLVDHYSEPKENENE